MMLNFVNSLIDLNFPGQGTAKSEKGLKNGLAGI